MEYAAGLTPLKSEDGMEIISASELVSQHPAFCSSVREFQQLLEAAEADLEGKMDRLGEQRRLLESRQQGRGGRVVGRVSVSKKTTAKNYVECQLFMLAKHRRRLNQFR